VIWSFHSNLREIMSFFRQLLLSRYLSPPKFPPGWCLTRIRRFPPHAIRGFIFHPYRTSFSRRKLRRLDPIYCTHFQAFFFPAAFAFAALFLLLLIMTTLKNVPTTDEPSRMIMTGMRIAQTRGGNRFWMGWSGSTNGYILSVMFV
jgi:predicted small integral membrane protein